MADFEVFCMGLFCGTMGLLLLIGAFAFVDSFIHKDKYKLDNDCNGDNSESDRQLDGMGRNISSHAKELTDEELAMVLTAIRITGICPSRDEKEYLAEAARRLKEGSDEDDGK